MMTVRPAAHDAVHVAGPPPSQGPALLHGLVTTSPPSPVSSLSSPGLSPGSGGSTSSSSLGQARYGWEPVRPSPVRSNVQLPSIRELLNDPYGPGQPDPSSPASGPRTSAWTPSSAPGSLPAPPPPAPGVSAPPTPPPQSGYTTTPLTASTAATPKSEYFATSTTLPPPPPQPSQPYENHYHFAQRPHHHHHHQNHRGPAVHQPTLHHHQHHHHRAASAAGGPGYAHTPHSPHGAQGPVPRRNRGNLPRYVTEILRTWLKNHIHHPYPNEQEKAELMKQTGLTLSQVSNWFINARRRQLPAMQARSGTVSPGDSPSSPGAGAAGSA